MSKQTKHRYLNSFFITTILYLVVSFFFFYVFADTLVVEEKKQEQLKISLNSMMALQEPTPTTRPTPSEPIIEKKIDKPKKEKRVEEKRVEEKKHDHTKSKHRKHIKEPIVEKNSEIKEVIETKNEFIPNTKQMIEISNNQTNSVQVENIETTYLSQIRSTIEKNKTYPKIAKRLNQTGKVYVTFLITKDGLIKNCRINKSSNFESLDEASMEILMKIVSFDAIPKELNKDSWEITVPIVYQIS
jgi:protein TonB